VDTERRGRRPGPSDTRETILAAARRQFSESGYDRASMRQVAKEAGVDPALVTHYFGSKPRLFAEAAEFPFSGAEVLPRLLEQGPDSAGAALARFALGVLESESGRERIVSVVRAAAAEPAAAEMIRERLTADILLPLAEGIGADRPAYRASLLMSQIVGLVMARYVVRIEPLAAAPADAVAADVAGTLQRYLTGPLPSDG
jgi:AcrR family transcriptional regulator